MRTESPGNPGAFFIASNEITPRSTASSAMMRSTPERPFSFDGFHNFVIRFTTVQTGSERRPWWVTGLQFTGVGWYIASAIVLGTLGGVWLDRQLGTSPLFILLGLAVGLTTAFYGTYRMLFKFLIGSKNPGNRQGPTT